MIKTTLLMVSLFTLLSCSGGGGGGGGNENTQQTVTVYWSTPNTREDGSDLKPSEIGGYIIIFLEEGELDYLAENYFTYLFNTQNFIDNPDIARYLPSYYLPQLLEEGFANLMLISNPSATSELFESLDDGTYYFAISTFDTDEVYGRLSKTVKTTVNN